MQHPGSATILRLLETRDARRSPAEPWIAIRKSKTPTFVAQFEVAQNYLSTLEKFNRRNHVLD
jgi:hypothetical protein